MAAPKTRCHKCEYYTKCPINQKPCKECGEIQTVLNTKGNYFIEALPVAQDENRS